MGWQDSVVCGDPSVVGWEDPGHFLGERAREGFFLGWEESVVGMETAFV